MAATLIYLHPHAPTKPEAGAACNGCGVCCAWQPCPLGVLVSGGRREGACAALRWDDTAQRYLCAMVSDPQAVWPRMPSALDHGLRALARRWIASGKGCDCHAEAEPAAPSSR